MFVNIYLNHTGVKMKVMIDEKSLFPIPKFNFSLQVETSRSLAEKELWGMEASRIKCDIKILFSRAFLTKQD